MFSQGMLHLALLNCNNILSTLPNSPLEKYTHMVDDCCVLIRWFWSKCWYQVKEPSIWQLHNLMNPFFAWQGPRKGFCIQSTLPEALGILPSPGSLFETICHAANGFLGIIPLQLCINHLFQSMSLRFLHQIQSGTKTMHNFKITA